MEAHTAERLPRIRKLTSPLERFVRIEASEGILLLVAAAAALAWANSPWFGAYDSLLHAPLSFSVGSLRAESSLHFFINDGLMVVFFFVVGLEIRRELSMGELSDGRRRALPLAAALGGMVVPALLYLCFGHPPEARRGWGVPMATDIAFAVGVLALLGKRVPAPLRVFLLALAIIDDIGAILVIALFYTSSLVPLGLVIAAAGVALVLGFRWLGIARPLAYVAPGIVVWYGLLRGGIHPTIGGVMLGLLTPVRGGWASPAVSLESKLHGWVAYGIMPLFALANAGVRVKGLHIDGESGGILGGILLGLVVGKPLGITLSCVVMVKLGLGALPSAIGFREVTLVGIVAGIGFTMALFIAGLAFLDPAMLAAAKLGVLCASTFAGLVGLLFGRKVLPQRPPQGEPGDPISPEKGQLGLPSID